MPHSADRYGGPWQMVTFISGHPAFALPRTSGNPVFRLHTPYVWYVPPTDGESLDPDALLESLKAGRYYSTQGPSLREMIVDGDRLRVETSEAYAISLTKGGDWWKSGSKRHGKVGASSTEAEFDLAPFRGSYCRVTAVDSSGRRAWGNPIWP